jgi:dihydrolipoamide dehydrogenase
VIVGGGPAGYEAALVAAQLGADVVLVERDGLGGACVLADCVPSKAFIAAAESPTIGADDLPAVNARVKALAAAQSVDVGRRLTAEGIELISGTARFSAPRRLTVRSDTGAPTELSADVVLIAVGAAPRLLPDARPDGQRILTWRQLYDLPAPPESLIVVGSGVTGAEFASGYLGLGVPVTLVSSRDRVLPGEDADAALLVEARFRRRGMTVLARSRAAAVRPHRSGVVVELTDGRTVEGSHCLLAVGSEPNTADLGLATAGIAVDDASRIRVDRVSRTSAPGIYAAGDCTGVLLLASVAAMQGRIAMWHALGAAVEPLRLSTVAATVFTTPEIATVGVASALPDSRVVSMPLATNARAKMEDIEEGFVKLYARPGTGTVLGGVIVAPRASELILPVSIAVQNALTVRQLANSFAIYPSLAGTLTEVARRLMAVD